MRDHPVVEQMNRFGYPKEVFEQPEHCGLDYFGEEILTGDKVYEFDGEMVLEENLEQYLVEVLGFEIREAQ